MTGAEFKDKLEKYRNDKNITVAEHDRLFRELKGVVLSTFKKIFSRYSNCIRRMYKINDVCFELENIYDVEFGESQVSLVYRDDWDGDTSSVTLFPIADFVRWIDNDTSAIRDYVTKDIAMTLVNDIEYNKKRIEYHKASIDKAEKFLAKMDEMKFKDVVKLYDELVENAI